MNKGKKPPIDHGQKAVNGSWENPRWPDGFGRALIVAGTALISGAALSVLLLLNLRSLGGPDLLRRLPPEMVVLRLLLMVPCPAVATYLIIRLPRTQRALRVWMMITAVATGVQLPFLFPTHVGGGAFIATALAANIVGIAVARGRQFQDLCAKLEEKGAPKKKGRSR